MDSNKMIMTIHIGNGTTPDGVNFEMMTTTSGAMIVQFENKDKYVMDWQEFVMECNKIRLKEVKKIHD